MGWVRKNFTSMNHFTFNQSKKNNNSHFFSSSATWHGTRSHHTQWQKTQQDLKSDSQNVWKVCEDTPTLSKMLWCNKQLLVPNNALQGASLIPFRISIFHLPFLTFLQFMFRHLQLHVFLLKGSLYLCFFIYLSVNFSQEFVILSMTKMYRKTRVFLQLEVG